MKAVCMCIGDVEDQDNGGGLGQGWPTSNSWEEGEEEEED